jgi:hypothetical protein
VKRILVLLAALVGFASPAQAYWEYGHQTVAAIAYRNVTPQVRAEIARMLARSGPLLETPECPTRTIEQASVWADCVKKLGDRFRYASVWHYQDVNICKPFDLMPACKDGNCVSAQIERDVKILKDRRASARDRAQALVFLIHFVGDLHQPLHAGEMDDQGGNKLKASYGIYSTRPARSKIGAARAGRWRTTWSTRPRWAMIRAPARKPGASSTRRRSRRWFRPRGSRSSAAACASPGC